MGNLIVMRILRSYRACFNKHMTPRVQGLPLNKAEKLFPERHVIYLLIGLTPSCWLDYLTRWPSQASSASEPPIFWPPANTCGAVPAPATAYSVRELMPLPSEISS